MASLTGRRNKNNNGNGSSSSTTTTTTTTTSNYKRLSWVDQIMIQFGTPTDKEIANAQRSIPNVWDEERVTWAEVHASLTKRQGRQRKSVVNKKAIDKILKDEKAAAKGKKKKNNDFMKNGWDTRDVCCVDEVWDGLFLGNMNSAASNVFIEKNNIGAILNVTPNIGQYYLELKNKRIDIADSADAPWEYRLMEAMDFLDRCYLSGTHVLVHCRMGQSRSVSYVLAWAMLRFKYPLRKLEAILKEKRYGGTQVNVGFRTRLGMIAEKLGMENMVSRSTNLPKRKRFSEEFAFASYKRADLGGGGGGISRTSRVYVPRIRVFKTRPQFLPFDLVFKKLNAKKYVGILYKDKTPGKMNSDGLMLGRNDIPMSMAKWEEKIACSRARNYNILAYIVNVDGVKLKNAVQMREFRVENADFFDSDKESEKKDDVVNVDQEKKDVEKTVPPPPPKQNTINEGNNKGSDLRKETGSDANSTDGSRNARIVGISSGIGPVVIV